MCYLTKEALEDFGSLKKEDNLIRTVKYVDDLVLLTEDETLLQGMTATLIEIEGCYGMETNVEKTTAMRISRQISPVQNMIEQKQQENVEYFIYFDSIITNDARLTHVKLNPGLPWQKQHSTGSRLSSPAN
jgi:DNA polymerase II large subunit